MAEYSTLAAVDLGSNSFHCQIARVVGDQLYPLDSLREPVRLGGGLTADKVLDDEVQGRALACLQRFGERLRGFDRHTVRAIGTNALRVAKNSRTFLKKAEAALGFSIEVVAGREEARLIYLGVAHHLPVATEKRLVVDIGGGSTEFIIGTGYKPLRLDSLFMGCVTYSKRYFGDGSVTKKAMKEAEIAARAELQPMVNRFSRGNWHHAVGSSGTARALADILKLNGFDDGDITPAGMERLRLHLIRSGDIGKAQLEGLRPDRVPVFPGGVAIMGAVLSELGVDRLAPAAGAMREGVLYDMLGRFHHRDMRDVTVAQFMQRYHVDVSQARRVGAWALKLYAQLATPGDTESAPQYLSWAAKLHEIGISVAYSGYHRHSAYIISNAEMPGFSRDEQTRLAALVLAHRRSLKKVAEQIDGVVDWPAVMALRLAALLCRGRAEVSLPSCEAVTHGKRVRLALDTQWLSGSPLTASALTEEAREWQKIGRQLEIPGVDAIEAGIAEIAVAG